MLGNWAIPSGIRTPDFPPLDFSKFGFIINFCKEQSINTTNQSVQHVSDMSIEQGKNKKALSNIMQKIV